MAEKDKGQAPTGEEQRDQQQQKSDCFSEGKAQGESQAKEGAAQERTKELQEGPAYTPEQEEKERQQAAKGTETKDDGDKQREGAQERTQELEKGPAYTPEQEENERQQAAQGKPANEGLASEGQAAEGQGVGAQPEPLMQAIGAAVVQATREAWDPADGQPERELN